MSSSPGPSVTDPPRLLISFANAESRSVSCIRRWAMPRRVDGVEARDATAAMLGVNSPTLPKSISMPVIWPEPEMVN